jgi:hypothetical protein
MIRYFLILNVTAALLATACGQGDVPAPPEDVAPAPGCPTFTPASAGLPEEGEWRTHPSVGDVNGDGLDDIAAVARKAYGPKVFLSDGLGGWTEASEGLKYETGRSCGIGTRLADLDGDGWLDLVVADHCKGVLVFRGDGGTTWVEDSRGIPRNLDGFNDADVGDVDGDGRLDIVAVSGFTRGFLVLQGQADGSWRVIPNTGLPETGGGFELSLTDINGDTRLDVLVTFNLMSSDRRGEPSPPAKVWLQAEDGRFRPATGFTDEGRFFGLARGVPRPDIGQELLFSLVGARAGIRAVHSQNGLEWTEYGRIDEATFGTYPGGFVGLETADIDGDGCTDLVTTDGKRMGIWMALGDCHGGWTFCPAETFPLEESLAPGWGVATGDLNGDGRTDVVAAFGLANTGGLKAWLQADPAPDVSVNQGHGPDELRPSRGFGEPVPAP